MFTLYRIVKRSVAESVPDRASVHTRNAAFEAFSASEQYWSAPLLNSVSDRFLKRSKSSLNTFIGPEHKLQRNLSLVNDLFKSKESVANCASEQFLHCNRKLILVNTVQGAIFETKQKPIWYSVNIA